MEKEGKSSQQDLKTLENPQKNPRKAATKLKQMQLNLQMMRNKFKVLEGQDLYNRYRTIDHSKRISHHDSIHQTISKEKESLKKSMDVRAEVSDIKAKNDQLRTQMKNKIAESRKIMLTERMERSQLIAEEFAKNEQMIKQIKEQDYELNKARKSLVLEQQEMKRENLKRHYQNKVKSTIFQKQKDSSNFNKEVSNLHEQLAQMLEFQKKLTQKYSRSLQTSQLMKNKFNQVINISQRSVSQKLPQIKSNTKHTSISQRL